MRKAVIDDIKLGVRLSDEYGVWIVCDDKLAWDGIWDIYLESRGKSHCKVLFDCEINFYRVEIL